MRDIAKKQDALEAKEAEEKARNNGLTERERAELETKRAEIARIEARTLMSEERTARESAAKRPASTVHPSGPRRLFTDPRCDRRNASGINEMVAKLAERTDNADKLLREIAKNVQEGKKTRIDPALSEEVKKLLRRVTSPDQCLPRIPPLIQVYWLAAVSGAV